MKKALIILIVFGFVAEMSGQLTGTYTDRLGQSAFDDMEDDYEQIRNEVGTNAIIINAMETIIRERNESMEIPLHTPGIRTRIVNYIWDGPAPPALPSTPLQGTSRHLLREKYPILVPYRSENRLKNVFILNRFRKKLVAERTSVEYYLGQTRKTTGGPILYLTEGTRIMMTLDAIEKVINITLENEEY